MKMRAYPMKSCWKRRGRGGKSPSALADAARKIMLEALSPHRVRFREESQVLAYQRFRPLLLLALSKLASLGIGCSPADGIRLVREFFINDWPDFGRDAGVQRVVGGFLSYADKGAISTERSWRIGNMESNKPTESNPSWCSVAAGAVGHRGGKTAIRCGEPGSVAVARGSHRRV